MRRILIAVVVVLILVTGSALLITPGGSADADAEVGPELEASSVNDALIVPDFIPRDDKVFADGVVVPAQFVELSLPSSGVIAEIMVDIGDQVEAGDAILRLDDTLQAVAVARAENALRRSQAELEQLTAGAREQELTAALADVQAAQAKLDKLTAGARAEDVAAAQAVLDAAIASRQGLFAAPLNEDVINAQTTLTDAEAELQRAQHAYNQVSSRADIGALQESTDLQTATNKFNNAKANVARLTQGPSSAAIAGADSEIEKAKAELERVRKPGSASDVSAAEAELRRAQAQYDLLAAGSRQEAITIAQSQVESARIDLRQEQVALDQLEIKAPIAGEIASLKAKVGEQVDPGDKVVQIGDLSVWQIMTDDLTELDITKISLGSLASIKFDAITDLQLNGEVVQIEPIGEEKAGDITYTIVVHPDEQDSRLQWNMTASVEIDAFQELQTQ